MLRALLLLFAITDHIHAEIPTVTIYVDDSYRPYSYEQNGEIKGLYNDILALAFSRMPNYNVTLKAVPWQRGKSLMEKGHGFALSPPYYHGHDWPFLYPYSLPYYEETLVTKCRGDKIVKSKMIWPKDYIGMRIGNINGFDGWGGKHFRILAENGKFIYTEVNSTNQLIHMLLAGRLDCIIIEELAYITEVELVSKTYNIHKNDIKTASIIGKDHVFLGYSNIAVKNKIYPYFQDFKRRFDDQIYQMKRSGEIQELIDEYTGVKND